MKAKARPDLELQLQMIERRLMEAEYLLDSTTGHVLHAKCDDIKPRALRRMYRALSAVRGARDRVRGLRGATQWTLFSGTATSKNVKANPQQRKQKPWKHPYPHGWGRDCIEEAERRLDLSVNALPAEQKQYGTGAILPLKP